MLYNIGDKFIVQGIYAEVAYINNDKAWVAPMEDDLERGLFRWLTFEVLDTKGKDRKGNKALVVSNQESKAV